MSEMSLSNHSPALVMTTKPEQPRDRTQTTQQWPWLTAQDTLNRNLDKERERGHTGPGLVAFYHIYVRKWSGSVLSTQSPQGSGVPESARIIQGEETTVQDNISI